MSAGMRAVLDHYMDALEQDTLDYHSVMAHAIRELLECRVHCHSDLARVQGDALEDYLPHHFHYLQFAYYKCEPICIRRAHTTHTGTHGFIQKTYPSFSFLSLSLSLFYNHSPSHCCACFPSLPPPVGQLLKAAEAAATYLGMVPSDEVMLHNVRYYTNQYKLQPEDFVPRDVSQQLTLDSECMHTLMKVLICVSGGCLVCV